MQDSSYKDCVARLRFVPHSADAMNRLPGNAIGWGNIPAQLNGTFNLTIVYEPEHEARILGLRSLAQAKDTTVQLFVEALVDREVAVLSCEVSEDYSLPSEYQAERGFRSSPGAGWQEHPA